MSLYELQSMLIELEHLGRPEGLSPEELDASRDYLRDLFKNDPSVRLK